VHAGVRYSQSIKKARSCSQGGNEFIRCLSTLCIWCLSSCCFARNQLKSSAACRCRIIPVLSRACLQSHRTFPPHRKEWYTVGIVTPNEVEWFKRVAGAVERITIISARFSDDEPGLAPQLLALAGTLAPNLQTLVLEGRRVVEGSWEDQYFDMTVSGPLIRSLAMLGQLRRLKLSNWLFCRTRLASEFYCFSCLRMLEVDSQSLPFPETLTSVSQRL
jgi:hypothetical protein